MSEPEITLERCTCYADGLMRGRREAAIALATTWIVAFVVWMILG